MDFNFNKDQFEEEDRKANRDRTWMRAIGSATDQILNAPSAAEILLKQNRAPSQVGRAFNEIADDIKTPGEKRKAMAEAYLQERGLIKAKDEDDKLSAMKDPESQQSKAMKGFFMKRGMQVDPADSAESLAQRFGESSKYSQAEYESGLKRREPKTKDPLAQELAHQRLEKMQREAAEAEFSKTPKGRLQNMNSGDKQRLDNVVGALSALTGMTEAYNAGDNTFSIVGDNDFTRNRTVWEETVGRMQSGGMIGKDEAKRFRDLVPTKWDNEDQQKKKLAEMKTLMEGRFSTMGFRKDDVPDLGYDPKALGFVPHQPPPDSDPDMQASAARQQRIAELKAKQGKTYGSK